jgi:hypothetical protein
MEPDAVNESLIQKMRRCSYAATDPNEVEIYARREDPMSNAEWSFLERIRQVSGVHNYDRVEIYSRRWRTNCGDSFLERIRTALEEVDPKGAEWVVLH